MATRRAAFALAASGLILGTSCAASASASTVASGGYGWIRLAHLSPNTPAVDVYLYSFGNPSAFLVLKHVSYGTVSPYERVAAGEYSVAMRAAGAQAGSSPVLSTGVTVDAGQAYTVAGMGPESGLRLAVLTDRLVTPPGRALVRVIQASLRQHVVDVRMGAQTLAGSLAFGTVSSYLTVPSGAATIQVTAGAGDASMNVMLDAATIHTLVVLDGTNGLRIVDLEDAAGNTAVPAGGVATGLGGTAPLGAPSPLPWAVLIAAGSLLALLAGVRLRPAGHRTPAAAIRRARDLAKPRA